MENPHFSYVIGLTKRIVTCLWSHPQAREGEGVGVGGNGVHPGTVVPEGTGGVVGPL